MRLFGNIEGIQEGAEFENRRTLAESGLHKPNQAGISGSGEEGADSIVLSGGYEDDVDYGDVIIYTGSGGRDPNTGKQIADQSLTRMNKALAKNKIDGLSVRVIRGHKHKSVRSPSKGYRYAGLYYVQDFWHEKGLAGYTVYKYKLIKENDPECSTEENSIQISEAYKKPERNLSSIQRIVRDTAISKKVKFLYSHKCQVCGIALNTPSGPYAEAAHIKPLGRPHDGPDCIENILCLCPNHHVLFDNGAFTIRDDYEFIGLQGKLMRVEVHDINSDYLKYHREHYYIKNYSPD